jgi:HK97 family phage prohead protease
MRQAADDCSCDPADDNFDPDCDCGEEEEMTMPGGILVRAAALTPQTFNPDALTVDAVFASGTPVARRDMLGRYNEVLSMDPAAADLSEFIGAPLLDSHARRSARNVYGSVAAARMENGQLTGRIQLSRAADAAPIVDRVREGSLRNLSIGYQILQSSEQKSDGVRTLTATRWKPQEASFVALGADPSAQVRSDDMRETADQIRDMTTMMNLPSTFADQLITRNLTFDDARTAIRAELVRTQPAINPLTPAVVTRDYTDDLVSRMADGLYSRINPAHRPTTGQAFAHASIRELAHTCLQARGLSTLGSSYDLITRAMSTTSDFPHVLAEVLNKNLVVITREPSPIQQIFRKSTVPNFRLKHFYDISDASALSKLTEAGEIKSVTVVDRELASYKADSYGGIFSLSFQAMTNDDLGVLQDLADKMTRGARAWYEIFLINTLLANPPLTDAQPLFSTAHKNLSATPAKPADPSIAEGKLGIRQQTDLNLNPLNLRPQYIVIPAALENTVDQLLATLYPAQPSQAEVAIRTLTPIIDSRLDAAGQTLPWYLFCDPSVAPCLEVSDLEGYAGPQVEVFQYFDYVGTKWRVLWHVGAGAIDYRGAWKNPGSVTLMAADQVGQKGRV